jgi:hypothetical protein
MLFQDTSLREVQIASRNAKKINQHLGLAPLRNPTTQVLSIMYLKRCQRKFQISSEASLNKKHAITGHIFSHTHGRTPSVQPNAASLHDAASSQRTAPMPNS